MDTIERNVSDVSHNYYRYLMNLQNVNGVGFGLKKINGIWTKEPCIHVLVEEKLEEKYLTKNNIIPKAYMGIKTDVINVGKTQTNAGANSGFKMRPLKGGCTVAVGEIDPSDPSIFNFSSGTLGCIVTRKTTFGRNYYILSNNHVLTDGNDFPIGKAVWQPEYSSGVSEEVAYLSEFIKVKFIGFLFWPINYVDCAIAKVKKKSLISNKIFGLGSIKGSNEPKIGLNVKKVGMRSGLTSGKITTLWATISIDFNSPKNIAIFKDTIVSDIYSAPGDSGACVLNDNNEAIGLLFGGTEKYSLMNYIEHVLNLLHVDIYTG